MDFNTIRSYAGFAADLIDEIEKDRAAKYDLPAYLMPSAPHRRAEGRNEIPPGPRNFGAVARQRAVHAIGIGNLRDHRYPGIPWFGYRQVNVTVAGQREP